jgi:hypothetical protein
MHGKKMMHATMLHYKYARTMRKVCYGTVQRIRRSGKLMHRNVSWIPILMYVHSVRAVVVETFIEGSQTTVPQPYFEDGSKTCSGR